jgi:hypothetical protein
MNATDEQVNALIDTLKPVSIKDQLKEFGKIRKEIEFPEDADYTALIEIQGFYPSEWPTGRTGSSQIDVFVSDFAVYGDVHEITPAQEVRIINAVYGLIY